MARSFLKERRGHGAQIVAPIAVDAALIVGLAGIGRSHRTVEVGFSTDTLGHCGRGFGSSERGWGNLGRHQNYGKRFNGDRAFVALRTRGTSSDDVAQIWPDSGSDK